MSEFTDYVLGQLEPAGTLRMRKMFGGTGVYADEVFCAIVTGSDRFYLSVDDSNRADFEAEKMESFPGRGGSRMPYFEVPARVLEDAQELEGSVRKARAAALTARSTKKPRAKRKPRAAAARSGE